MRNVEKLNPGDSVENFFLIHRATQGVTAQGKDYMTLFLQDKVVILKPNYGLLVKKICRFLNLRQLFAKGDVINYRGRKQMKVNQFRLAKPEDGFKTQDFVAGAPLSPDEIQENISHYILDIENANLQRITRHLLKISR